MHIGFQCLLNEFTDDTDLQYYDFGDPAHSPQTPADLHQYVTHMFRSYFSAQHTPAPALHDGSVSWDSLQTMSFEEFKENHSSLAIPVIAGSDPLFALWSALHHSPSREAVFADLHPLLHQAPPNQIQTRELLRWPVWPPVQTYSTLAAPNDCGGL